MQQKELSRYSGVVLGMDDLIVDVRIQNRYVGSLIWDKIKILVVVLKMSYFLTLNRTVNAAPSPSLL